MASPPGMLVSDSTHMPPTGTNWPVLTFSRIRPKSSGYSSLIQASCWAEEQENTNPGSSSISATTLENVRAHLRMVSRTGQSQAESMCACPVASRWCAEA